MKLVFANNLVCPLDGSALTPREQSLTCPKGHNFDKARQGYLNLLVVQHKASRDPGDTKEMVAARTRFLRTGCYEPIANAIADLTEKHLANIPVSEQVTILDAGCGEGYYLDWIGRKATKWNYSEGVLIGLDISKWAIQSAVKRSRDITWIVGSNRRPPFLAGSIDSIVCAFGFPSFEDFRHVLKPGGKVILVDPGVNHLLEMRQVIYSELRERGLPAIASTEVEGFKLVDRYNLTYQSEVSSSEDIQDLFAMTPHYFRSPQSGKIALAKLHKLSFTVDVNFRIFAAIAKDVKNDVKNID
ncbi:methyltransferase domain-containing protein [Tumidithrix elongata RA019]|uniref:Methyltransferase domain-containing protein n=1 Tax=Tumidithrix elongata BACA0141 TaxID=2716417 RepID=A0AAW9QA86_9CYAN|nr:methyltransferase domain-containing protein [Tumidithrix elongata RA019]